MSRTVSLDPVTRIEGHLAVRVEVENGLVGEAFCSGEMFRGFEAILRGRHPMDAQQITQRICGVCPISHGLASIKAQDQCYGVTPPENGRLMRNLILGANYLASHITHFYLLSALDFVDVTAVTRYTGADPALIRLKDWITAQAAAKTLYPAAPFLPRYEGGYIQDDSLNLLALRHYLDALRIRAQCHKMAALFAGKMPHSTTLVPGGITEHATADKIAAYASILKEVRSFVSTVYVPDVLAVAQAFDGYFSLGRGPGNFLSFGVFDEESGTWLPSGTLIQGRPAALNPEAITEEVARSLFTPESGGPPATGRTVAAPGKADAYTWLKAPRYEGQPMEVGPLARILVAWQAGRPDVRDLVDRTLARLGKKPEDLVSVMGRHAARALEALLLADRCAAWVDRLTPGNPGFAEFTIPPAGTGMGLTEASRGALGHWLTVEKGLIANYQCVVPTTWNCSPRDGRGVPGPVEQALVGTPVADPQNPIEAARVVRSFDPCLACAVH